jgi:hypothetical protein
MSNIDLDEIRQRAEERVKAKRDFGTHATVYGVGMVIMWVFWAIFIPVDAGFVFIPSIISLGWTIAIVIHALVMAQKLRIDGVMAADAVHREMAREMRLRGIDPETAIPGYIEEKPKRNFEKNKSDGKAMRLSDDGELVEEEEDEDQPVLRSTRNGRA